MPYAVIVPGLSTVYNKYEDVERICSLYPYPKFRKFQTEEECWEYVKRHTSKKVYTDITKYGETFNSHYVKMEYFIRSDKVYYNYFTKQMGYISIENHDPNVIVENMSGSIKAILTDIYLNDDMINSHLIAIWHGLKIIGEYVDIDVQVPDHSVFYALMTYKGNSRTINRVRNYIDTRAAKVSVSMKDWR